MGAAESAAVLALADAPGQPARAVSARSASSRLDTARAVLAQAEARTGLRTRLPTSVDGHGGLAAASLPSVPASGSADPLPAAAPPWEVVVDTTVGVLSLTGSMTLLLAAAARRQGAQGWCAVLGGQDLGWCAAAEAGLDLDRLLVVPAREVAQAVLPAVVGALVDGLDVVLLTGGTARLLTARQQQVVAARARARGCLLLLDEPWEAGRVLRARPEVVAGQDPGPVPEREPGGTVVQGPGRVPAQPPGPVPEEMVAGYLRHLDWVLTEPQRGSAASLLRHGPDGVRVVAGGPPQAVGPTPPVLTVLPGGLP